MSAQYTYSISEDTATGTAYLPTLELEITDSGLVGYEYLTAVGDVLEVWFMNTLSSSDEDLLTSVIAAHDGTPVPWEKKHVAYTYDTGRLITETWYAKSDDSVLSGKVEETVYSWLGARLLTETITRFDRTGSVESVESFEYCSDGCQVRKEKTQ